MGGSLSFLSSPLHIVMVGLDSAGKTTVLYRLKFNQYISTVPTIGFNCEKIRGTTGKCKGVDFVMWDVGGQEKLRPLWRAYTRATDGIVFVVDSSDVERFDEAKVELHRTLRAHPRVPLMVLANKQDLPGATPINIVQQALDLKGPQMQQCHVIPTCAVIGEGLSEGLEDLYRMIQKQKSSAKRIKLKF